MAESVVSSVVESLGKLLIQEANSLGGVSRKAKHMQTELKLIQGFLEDVDKRQDPDKRIEAWVSEIREAAYDAENVIEIFALKIASKRKEGIQNPFKRCVCIFDEVAQLHKVGSQIEEITTRISNFTRSLETYGIKPITSHKGEASSSMQGMQHQQRRQSYGHVIEEYTVGLERDVEILVAQLVNVDSCGVVCICGMGGLGKTTLAKKVFHHNDIRRSFHYFAWAYISQQFQPRDVWEGILFELLSPSKERREEIKELRKEELARKLCQVLEEKKCLVILDDIWTAEAWHDLHPAFPVGKAGSKVLLTARNKEVAPSSFLHEPRCLNEEESWELLVTKAFPAGKHDPDFKNDKDMEKLGRKMVEKYCSGLPLAIIVLGGVLASKCTLNEWNIVHESISSNVRTAKGHGQQYSRVLEVFALSYHELPYHLKACFLHLGHFPEDFEIPTKKLVRMWVAEGMVSSKLYHEVVGKEAILEDIGQHYLDELIYRCMVQVGVVGSTGRVKTCRLHDLMRDFCLLKAKQGNFLEIVHLPDENKEVDSNSISSTHPVHRLAIYLGEERLKFIPKLERNLNLRSLFFFGPHNNCTKISIEVQSRFSNFKLLKILDLKDCGIEGKLTSAIGNLIHLRYLSLHFCVQVNLPSSIGNLRFLETLILSSDDDVRIPNVIWKMECLRHLYLPDMKKCRGKLRLENLRALQTLQGFDTRICGVKVLTKLTNLRKLGIIDLESCKVLVEVLRSSSATFINLFSLKIIGAGLIIEESDLRGLLSGCPKLYKLRIVGLIKNLPEFHQFPPNLTKLTLSYSYLEEDPMATLEKLPNLSILILGWCSFIGKKMVCSSKAFPRLKSLGIKQFVYLEDWFVSEEAMPSLYELTIKFCWRLKMIPDGLRSITTLRELKIEGMLEEFNNRLQGGEDSHKVQHVPSIIIR